jgi:hypothetical protein
MHEHTLLFHVVPADHPGARYLAEKDSPPFLKGDVLLAERAGEPIAAIALADGAVVADPFRPTAAETGMLRARREQIQSQPQGTRRFPASRARTPATA